jgi:two-component system sensor histidine kinase/response regulator
VGAAAAGAAGVTAVTTPSAEDPLPAIEGVDAADGLARLAGNRRLYLKLLRQFVEQQGDAPDRIAAALASGDLALAERLAHTLKGVTGNVGAKGLQAVAGALEKAIAARAPAGESESARQRVAAALAPLIGSLRAAVCPAAAESPAAAVPAPVDRAQSRAAAERLSALLAEFDPDAVGFVEANRAVLQPLFTREAWEAFERLVQGYAFAEAQAQVTQALAD